MARPEPKIIQPNLTNTGIHRVVAPRIISVFPQTFRDRNCFGRTSCDDVTQKRIEKPLAPSTNRAIQLLMGASNAFQAQHHMKTSSIIGPTSSSFGHSSVATKDANTSRLPCVMWHKPRISEFPMCVSARYSSKNHLPTMKSAEHQADLRDNSLHNVQC